MVELINISQELVNAEFRGFNQAVQFNANTFLLIYICVLVGMATLILWFYFWHDSRQTRFLRFTSSNEAKIVKGNVDNQMFKQKNKKWHINKAKPILLNTFFGKRPMYLIKDDCAICWEFGRAKKIKLSAESLKNFCDHENIKQILRLTVSDKKEKFLFLAMGAVVGAVIGILIGTML